MLGNTLVGSLLVRVILARRTRAMIIKLNTMTMPEFLEARYQSRGMKIFSALVIFILPAQNSAKITAG